MSRTAVLSLGTSDWNYPYWTSRQFLMYELAAYCDVIYATDRHDIRAVLKRPFGAARRSSAPFPAPSNLRVLKPVWPRIYRYKTIDNLFQSAYVGRLQRSLAASGARRLVAYVWNPIHVEALKRLKVDVVVYHPYDMFRHFVGSDEDVVRREEEICGLADLVITPHRRVAEALGHPNTHVINNGVFLPAFPDISTITATPKLSKRTGPVVGYVGAINDKVDFSVLCGIFSSKPDWTLVMVGFEGGGNWKQSRDYQELSKLDNVTFLDGVPINALAPIIAAFNVGIIPYALTGWAAFSESPLKLYQYWAMGVPIVCSRLPSLSREPGMLEIAGSVGEWQEAIERQLHFGDAASRKTLRAKAMENSWAAKAKTIFDLIEAYEVRAEAC